MHLGKAVAAVGVGLLLAACGANDEPSSTPAGEDLKPGGTLTILTDNTTFPFDPAKSQGLAITSNGLVHRRLTTWKVAKGQTTEVVPDLAEDTGKASDGGRTWTFTLKDGLKFSDGSPITSADVKWGIERSFAPAFSGGLGYHKTLLEGGPGYQGPFDGKELDSVETPDDRTVVFHLSRPYGDWPWVVSTPAFSPVPEGKGAEADYGEHPVTSGPYQVSAYEKGVQVTLTRNPHWDEKSDEVRLGLPDKVVFSLGQDATVVSQRLVEDTGDDQSAFSASFVSPAQLAQLRGDPDASRRLVTSESGALAFLALNTQRGVLTDPEVRKAFQYAVDKSAYQVASAGNAKLAGDIATTLITPGINGREEFDLYKTKPTGDPDKARKLLAEAGHPNGLDGLQLVVGTENNYPEKAQAIQAALAKANIRVDIRSLDSDAYDAEVTTNPNPTYDLTLTSWQPDFPSPNANLQPLFASSEIGGGGYNTARYSDPDIDQLIEEAQSTVDADEAGSRWAAIDKKILEDSPVVPLIYTRNSFLHGSKVVNFLIGEFPAYQDYRLVGLSQ
ncbi:ABC transporter substrate-binding protein [Actinophytocola oryzae]|uniref:Peptide/nickel transport system substrate-binding protein n=1 Tax=Actinophytocola oryzae TaxID=502181 RepID=A0A4V3FUQ4_9PSEU|nr:ABC transporter substrate-binding protein [Actinophytocola oryzae]TDV56071.1 peptide/nickel transport system substrate-binding protein [Actinophytocola oryzae]